MPSPPDFEVLVFSRTTGHYRHDSIPAGIDMVRNLGAEHGFGVTATEDPSAFVLEELSRYAAVVWLNTGGDVLDPAGRAAFERYVAGGGGYVGVHGAAATEYDWPFYEGLVGAYFARHPDVCSARIVVLGGDHPSTEAWAGEMVRVDEWYEFRSPPPTDAQVLVEVDGSSYAGPAGLLPITWAHEYRGGRSWYTGMGHTIECYTEPFFAAHVLGGIRSVADAGVSRRS